jgi:hypothetical protein
MAHVWKIQKRESQGQRAAGATKTLTYHDFQGNHKVRKANFNRRGRKDRRKRFSKITFD